MGQVCPFFSLDMNHGKYLIYLLKCHIFLLVENYDWDNDDSMSNLTFLGYIGVDENVRTRVTKKNLP